MLEAAAVIGKEFLRGARPRARRPSRRATRPCSLMSLVRKELIRPERSTLPGEDAFRFRHLLDPRLGVRGDPEGAARRAARARSPTGSSGSPVSASRSRRRSSAYHLEQAYRLRMELGPDDDRGLELARAAATHLAAAGRRSYARGDTEGAITLFSRAVDLLPVTDPERVRYGIELGNSLAWGGREVSAIEVLAEADRAAAATGDLGLAMHASLALTDIGSWRDFAAWVRWKPEAERAIEVFEPAGDDAGLARAWFLLAWDHNVRFHFAEQGPRRSACARPRRGGGRPQVADRTSDHVVWSPVWGPTSVTEGLARCEEVSSVAPAVGRSRPRWRGPGRRSRRCGGTSPRRGNCTAREGGDRRARPTGDERVRRPGGVVHRDAREGLPQGRRPHSIRVRRLWSRSLPLQDITRDLLALSLCAQGRFEEADVLARETEEIVFEIGDVVAENVWRRVRARSFSARGDHREAVRLAREADALFKGTDALNDHGECSARPRRRPPCRRRPRRGRRGSARGAQSLRAEGECGRVGSGEGVPRRAHGVVVRGSARVSRSAENDTRLRARFRVTRQSARKSPALSRSKKLSNSRPQSSATAADSTGCEAR